MFAPQSDTLQLTGQASSPSHRGEHHNLLKSAGCILSAAELPNGHKWLVPYTSITRHLFIPRSPASICSFADTHELLLCITTLVCSLGTRVHPFERARIFSSTRFTHMASLSSINSSVQPWSYWIFSDSSSMLTTWDVFWIHVGKKKLL